MLSPIYMLTYISLSSSESLAFCLKASWQLLLSSADPSLFGTGGDEPPAWQSCLSWGAAQSLAGPTVPGAAGAKEGLE